MVGDERKPAFIDYAGPIAHSQTGLGKASVCCFVFALMSPLIAGVTGLGRLVLLVPVALIVGLTFGAISLRHPQGRTGWAVAGAALNLMGLVCLAAVVTIVLATFQMPSPG